MKGKSNAVPMMFERVSLLGDDLIGNICRVLNPIAARISEKHLTFVDLKVSHFLCLLVDFLFSAVIVCFSHNQGQYDESL